MAEAKREYVVDEKGRRRSVVVPIEEYKELMEDLQDLAIIAERRDEPTEPLKAVKKRLEAKWLRTKSK